MKQKKSNPTHNHWTGFKDQIIWWDMEFHCNDQNIGQLLNQISEETITICNQFQILVPFNTESSEQQDSSVNNFAKLSTNLWTSSERAISELEDCNFPFFSQLFFFDQNNELQFEHVLSVGYYFQDFENSFRCYSLKQISSIPSTITLSAQDTPIFVYQSIVEEDSKRVIQFSFCINSDLWFTDNHFAKKEDDSPFIKKNNRYLAYRNTPRLNSFLRELKKMTTSFNGHWNCTPDTRLNKIINGREDQDFDFLATFGNCGIPLDGKIIYQEDIDEGRIKLPKWNE